ncbi:MAG: hypothetical protein AB7P14_18505 [Blastocatellales bacterium]
MNHQAIIKESLNIAGGAMRMCCCTSHNQWNRQALQINITD